MESSAKERTEGTQHQLRGKVKEVAGFISDSPNSHRREADGTGARTAGTVQPKIGQFNQFWGK